MARSRSKHNRMKSRRRQQWKARIKRHKAAAAAKKVEKAPSRRASAAK